MARMKRRIRHCLHLLRLPVSALLMLAVLVVPVFAALGDLHEAQQGGHAHLHAVGEHADGLDGDVQDGDGDLLHALMHASHCCGHPSMILESFHLAAPVVVTLSMPTAVPADPRLEVSSKHFRPPIAG